MGQAKRRGSREERVALAQERQKELRRKSAEEAEARRLARVSDGVVGALGPSAPLLTTLAMASSFMYFPTPSNPWGPPRRKERY